MLTRLAISNYALIDDLSVTFEPGLNIITGETGAGKSIMLGALSLMLGMRADLSMLRYAGRKCIVEGVFRLDHTGLNAFFEENDLDYDPVSIIRREISATGKSRAFVNDTPVTLQQLHDLTSRLVDIHSQHQNLELGNQQFQLQIIDCVARNSGLRNQYQECFRHFLSIRQSLDELRVKAARNKADLDYFLYQYTQLEEARLQPDEQTVLEDERNILNHAEEIKSALGWVSETLQGEVNPVVPRIREAVSRLEKITLFIREAEELAHRLRSVQIELNDLAHESRMISEKTSFDTQRLAEITEKLDLIYTLEQKHQCSSVEELIRLRDGLKDRIREISQYDEDIQGKENQLKEAERQLADAAALVTRSRKNVMAAVEEKVTGVLIQLAIPNARFKIEHELKKQPAIDGTDNVRFLFSANRDTEPAEISRIASGGEISRVMLALKTLISDSNMLSTIIFDEIDAGISGETALKMGNILKSLSKGIQVINITHLPQIAGKGDHQFQVIKQEDQAGTRIMVRKLSNRERITELARMVGGDDPSEAAKKAAREMLEN